jgi:hypothetical protein
LTRVAKERKENIVQTRLLQCAPRHTDHQPKQLTVIDRKGVRQMSAKSHALSQVEGNQVELASSGSLSDRAVALLDSQQLLSRDDKKAYDKLQAAKDIEDAEFHVVEPAVEARKAA